MLRDKSYWQAMTSLLWKWKANRAGNWSLPFEGIKLPFRKRFDELLLMKPLWKSKLWSFNLFFSDSLLLSLHLSLSISPSFPPSRPLYVSLTFALSLYQSISMSYSLVRLSLFPCLSPLPPLLCSFCLSKQMVQTSKDFLHKSLNLLLGTVKSFCCHYNRLTAQRSVYLALSLPLMHLGRDGAQWYKLSTNVIIERKHQLLTLFSWKGLQNIRKTGEI